MNIYDFKVNAADGSEVSLSHYKGKVLLIVNTATGCSFTPQYTHLQEIYDEYKAQGFEILDFPCNQFGNQAPGSDEEINSFCTLNYNTEFPRFSKVDVNGENASELFSWLTANSRFEGFGMSPMGIMLSGMMKKMDKDYKNSSSIKWNFTKFLIDRNGEIAARFEPTDMKNLRVEIEKCL